MPEEAAELVTAINSRLEQNGVGNAFRVVFDGTGEIKIYHLTDSPSVRINLSPWRAAADANPAKLAELQRQLDNFLEDMSKRMRTDRANVDAGTVEGFRTQVQNIIRQLIENGAKETPDQILSRAISERRLIIGVNEIGTLRTLHFAAEDRAVSIRLGNTASTARSAAPATPVVRDFSAAFALLDEAALKNFFIQRAQAVPKILDSIENALKEAARTGRKLTADEAMALAADMNRILGEKGPSSTLFRVVYDSSSGRMRVHYFGHDEFTHNVNISNLHPGQVHRGSRGSVSFQEVPNIPRNDAVIDTLKKELQEALRVLSESDGVLNVARRATTRSDIRRILSEIYAAGEDFNVRPQRLINEAISDGKLLMRATVDDATDQLHLNIPLKVDREVQVAEALSERTTPRGVNVANTSFLYGVGHSNVEVTAQVLQNNAARIKKELEEILRQRGADSRHPASQTLNAAIDARLAYLEAQLKFEQEAAKAIFRVEQGLPSGMRITAKQLIEEIRAASENPAHSLNTDGSGINLSHLRDQMVSAERRAASTSTELLRFSRLTENSDFVWLHDQFTERFRPATVNNPLETRISKIIGDFESFVVSPEKLSRMQPHLPSGLVGEKINQLRELIQTLKDQQLDRSHLLDAMQTLQREYHRISTELRALRSDRRIQGIKPDEMNALNIQIRDLERALRETRVKYVLMREEAAAAAEQNLIKLESELKRFFQNENMIPPRYGLVFDPAVGAQYLLGQSRTLLSIEHLLSDTGNLGNNIVHEYIHQWQDQLIMMATIQDVIRDIRPNATRFDAITSTFIENNLRLFQAAYHKHTGLVPDLDALISVFGKVKNDALLAETDPLRVLAVQEFAPHFRHYRTYSAEKNQLDLRMRTVATELAILEDHGNIANNLSSLMERLRNSPSSVEALFGNQPLPIYLRRNIRDGKWHVRSTKTQEALLQDLAEIEFVENMMRSHLSDLKASRQQFSRRVFNREVEQWSYGVADASDVHGRQYSHINHPHLGATIIELEQKLESLGIKLGDLRLADSNTVRDFVETFSKVITQEQRNLIEQLSSELKILAKMSNSENKPHYYLLMLERSRNTLQAGSAEKSWLERFDAITKDINKSLQTAMNQFALIHGYPPMQLRLTSALEHSQSNGHYSPTTASASINRSKLVTGATFDDSLANFLSTTYHEFGHHDQLVAAIWAIADKLQMKTLDGLDGTLVAKVRGLLGNPSVSEDFIRAVIDKESRRTAKMTPEEATRNVDRGNKLLQNSNFVFQTNQIGHTADGVQEIEAHLFGAYVREFNKSNLSRGNIESPSFKSKFDLEQVDTLVLNKRTLDQLYSIYPNLNREKALEFLSRMRQTLTWTEDLTSLAEEAVAFRFEARQTQGRINTLKDQLNHAGADTLRLQSRIAELEKRLEELASLHKKINDALGPEIAFRRALVESVVMDFSRENGLPLRRISPGLKDSLGRHHTGMGEIEYNSAYLFKSDIDSFAVTLYHELVHHAEDILLFRKSLFEAKAEVLSRRMTEIESIGRAFVQTFITPLLRKTFGAISDGVVFRSGKIIQSTPNHPALKGASKAQFNSELLALTMRYYKSFSEYYPSKEFTTTILQLNEAGGFGRALSIRQHLHAYKLRRERAFGGNYRDVDMPETLITDLITLSKYGTRLEGAAPHEIEKFLSEIDSSGAANLRASLFGTDKIPTPSEKLMEKWRQARINETGLRPILTEAEYYELRDTILRSMLGRFRRYNNLQKDQYFLYHTGFLEKNANGLENELMRVAGIEHS